MDNNINYIIDIYDDMRGFSLWNIFVKEIHK